MKKGWELKRLDEVCIVERGSSPRPIKDYLTTSKDGVNWIKIGDTKGVEKYIYSTKEKITKEGAKQSRFVKEGDFILTNSMSFGNPYIMKTEGYIHDGWFVLRLKNHIDAEYFWYLLVSPLVREQFDTLASGAIVKNISSDLVKKVILPIPPLPEQQRIVALLDETFAALTKVHANAERNQVNAREVFEAALAKMYENAGEHWEEKNLGDIASQMQTGPFGSTLHKSDYVENGIPVINPQNLVDGRIVPLQKMMVSQKTKERLSRYILQEKDIVLARRGEMGRCAIVEKEQAGWLCGSGSFVVRIKKEVDANYLVRYLSSAKVKRILQKGSVGTTMDNLNQGILSQVPVPFPPLAEQRAIVQRLDALAAETRRLEEVYQSKVEAVEELRKSVLQKAFNGDL